MRLLPILNTYDAVLLDQISADKVDEVLNLRLPPSVIIQEIVSALSSQSYISRKVVYAKPPTFAILNLIMQSPGYMVEIDTFRDNVLAYINRLNQQVSKNSISLEKNPKLYAKILKRAWDNDGEIDKSEAHKWKGVRTST